MVNARHDKLHFCTDALAPAGEHAQVPVTAMLPLVLFPALGIMSGRQTAKCYMSDTHFVFIGSFFLANAVERVLLHRRIAVNLMRCVTMAVLCSKCGTHTTAFEDWQAP